MQLHSNTGQATSEQAGTFDAVHTPQQPYCNEYPHWCHEDANYHQLVITPQSDLSTHENEELFSLFGLGGELR